MEDTPSGESECREHGRSGDCSDLSRTVLILALKVPHPRKPLGPRQTGLVGHANGKNQRSSTTPNLAKSRGRLLGRRDGFKNKRELARHGQ